MGRGKFMFGKGEKMAREDIGAIEDLSGPLITVLQEILSELVLLRKQMTCQHVERLTAHPWYRDGELMDAGWRGEGVCERCGIPYRAPSPYINLKH